MSQRARSEYLGSGDAASIASIEPYGCRRSLVYKKIGLAPDDADKHAERFGGDEGPVARGIELEPLIRARVERKIGPCQEWRAPAIEMLMPPRPPLPQWMGATPDGIVGPLSDEQIVALAALCRVTLTDEKRRILKQAGILEGKTVQMADFWRIAKEGMRLDHLAQVSHQLAVTAAPWCLVAVLHADNWRWTYHIVFRDEAFERDTYLPAAMEAWAQITRARSGIQLGASPDEWEPFLPARLPEGSKQCRTCDHRRACWGSAYTRVMEIPTDGDAIRMDGNPEWEAAAAELTAANEVLAEAEAMKESATERLKALMGDQPVAEGAGLRIYYKPQVSNRVDTTALKRDLPEIAAKYTKPSTSRPFRAFQV